VDGSGTGTTFWGDLPVRGPNLIVNPNFAIRNSSVATPQGWTLVGSPSLANNALSGADLSEGRGIALTIAANNAAQEGISQTLRPRASTRYLVLARVKATSGDAHLETTGADVTSSFRNIDDTTSSTSYVTLKGVIQTDSTPTDIVVQVLTNGDSDTNDIKVSFVGVYECHADHAILCGSGSFELTSTSAVTLGSAAFADVFVGAAIEVRVPGPGFEIHAEAIVPLANTTAGAEAVAVRITENASPSDTSVWELEMPATSTATAVVSFVNTAPVAGTLYTYDVSGRSTVAASLTTNGTSLVTGTPTRTAILRVRVVRVSE